MASFQISCVGGQCSDPACGTDYIFVGGRQLPADAIIQDIEAGRHRYWTVAQDRAVPVVVALLDDGRKRLVADLTTLDDEERLAAKTV